MGTAYITVGLGDAVLALGCIRSTVACAPLPPFSPSASDRRMALQGAATSLAAQTHFPSTPCKCRRPASRLPCICHALLTDGQTAEPTLALLGASRLCTLFGPHPAVPSGGLLSTRDLACFMHLLTPHLVAPRRNGLWPLGGHAGLLDTFGPKQCSFALLPISPSILPRCPVQYRLPHPCAHCCLPSGSNPMPTKRTCICPHWLSTMTTLSSRKKNIP